MMHIALFQPEIAQNVGTLLRFGACMNVKIHIIEPCGFLMTDTKLRRAGMDYADLAQMERYPSWEIFRERGPKGRLLATTPQGVEAYHTYRYQADDIILMGQESVGLPQEIIDACDTSLKIVMEPGRRSLNVAISAAMIAGEAIRQTEG